MTGTRYTGIQDANNVKTVSILYIQMEIEIFSFVINVRS